MKKQILLLLNFILISAFLNITSLSAQTYCTSKGTAPWEVWIAGVDFYDIHNLSGKFKDYATFGYSDYTNLSTTVAKGQTHSLSITPPTGWNGYFKNIYCRVWIDFNGNKIFEDNEIIIEKTNTNSLTANVLIPNTAITGSVRMRVALKFGAYPTACETFDKGEVEDYTLNITQATSLCTNDVAPPVFTNCPTNQLKEGAALGCTPIFWSVPTVTDNCSTPSVSFVTKRNSTILFQSDTISAVQLCPTNYTDTVIYTARDARGNTSTCQFEIKAIDRCISEIRDERSLPTDQILPATVGNCAPFKWAVPVRFFPCGRFYKYEPWALPTTSPSVTISRADLRILNNVPSSSIVLDSACFPMGTTVVTYRDFNDVVRTFSVTVSNPNQNSPDLTLKNLAIPTPSVQQGNILYYNFDLKNIAAPNVRGTTNANGNFTIKSYLSTDQTLSTDDYQDGTVPTGNLAAGASVLQILGAATIRNTIPVGNYYLILKVDADNEIAEFNENNNVIVSTTPFAVTATQTGVYCTSKSVAPWEYAIAKVILNTMNNNSDKFKDFATLGYSDYTDFVATVSKGQTYPLSITPLLSWIGNLPNAYCRVWIDFNGNKTFEANELVLEKTNANPLTTNVLIPNTAVTGSVRMRVALKFGAYPTACETFDKGEVEDYMVNIQEGSSTPTCSIANVISNISCNNMGTLNDPTDDTFSYILKVTNSNNGGWNALVGTANISGPYNSETLWGGYPIKNGPISWLIKDNQNSACMTTVTVTPPATCSSPNTGAKGSIGDMVFEDLNKNGVQDAGELGVPGIQVVIYKLDANGAIVAGNFIRNTGTGYDGKYLFSNLDAGNYKVKFTTYSQNQGILYNFTTPNVGTNDDIDSDADYNGYTPSIALAAGQNITNIDAGMWKANSFGNTVIALNKRKPTQLVPIVIQEITPTLSEGDITVLIESIIEKDVQFDFYNTLGKVVKTDIRHVEKGINHLLFDFWSQINGLYFIQTSEGQGRGVPLKFVKF